MNKYILIVIVCAFLGAVAQILLKHGSGGAKQWFEYANFYVFLGLLLYGVAMIGYLWALPHGEVSIFYPVLALSYLFVTILSAVFLKENLTLAKALGSAGIILCVWVIAR